MLAGADFGFEVGTVRLWDLVSGQERFSVGEHAEAIMDVQFSVDGGIQI